MSGSLEELLKIFGAGIAFLGFLWAIASKMIDKHHNRTEKLEKQRNELKKELEQTKQRHIQKLMDAMKTELVKLSRKLDDMRKSHVELDKKIFANEGKAGVVLDAVNDFQKETSKRFIAVEKQVNVIEQKISEVDTKVESQMEKIGKDLYIIREAARKVKTNKGGGQS